ncbi:hypothetical protein A5712_02950 [Mycobacterium sp. E2327]|nr:hypothetical protein [Mycobacterium sp. E2327]OBI14833.1 hypothetical protein A5712_02950 [Mycobacterium sp. E2327]
MIVTGAFLAEAAAVVDNKLNVTGGVLSRFVVGPDRFASFLLVVLTQSDADDDDRLDVEIWPPAGQKPLRVAFHMPPEATVGEIGFAFFPVSVAMPVDGRWVIVVAGGPGVISLPLIVTS